MRISGNHYTGFHNVIPITDYQLNDFKKLLSCNTFDRIEVIQRIGSESLYATIWEIKFDLGKEKITMAIKIQKNIEKTLEEININKFLNEYPEYFLQMYDSIYCQKISLLKESSFSGYFIFMELAIADLAQFLTLTNVSENDLDNFIMQVFDSIYVLGKSQLFHGDLHIRNVFIVPRDNQIKAVIGDFGETIGIDSITSHTSDIYKFLSSLSEFLNKFPNKYRNTKNKIKDIIRYVNRLTVTLEDDYDTWNDKHRDDEGDVNYEELDAYFASTVGKTVSDIKKMMSK